jgi:peroxiredoxin family protein
MKYIKSLYEYVNLSENNTTSSHIKADPESEVTVSDIKLDSGKDIKAQEIMGVIVSANSEEEVKDYFFTNYGNNAFTKEEMSTIVAAYQKLEAENTEKKKEKEKEEEGGDDPLAGLDV